MTRDEHVQKILDFIGDEIGTDRLVTIESILFVLLDQAIAEGVRQGRYEQAQEPSRN